MPGDVGLVAKLIERLAGWLLSEDGLREVQKRRALRAKKDACRRALADGDWARLRELTWELERLSSAP